MADNFSVGNSYDKSIFLGTIFIIILDVKILSLLIVGLSLSSSSEFSLISSEVSFIFDEFDEYL